MKRILIGMAAAGAMICGAGEALAQGKFDYSAFQQGLFTPKTVSGIRSTADGEYYTSIVDEKIRMFTYATGEDIGLVFGPELVEPRISFTDYQLSPDESRVLLTTEVRQIYRRSFTARYWIYDRMAGSLRQLSNDVLQQNATFSPDGERVAFVRENNLFVVTLADGVEQQITTDGEFNRIINGRPDWVYEEEFSVQRAFEWSPCGTKIAYLRFDESRVREFSMNLFEGQLYPRNYTYKYPKAGEENSVVEVHLYDLKRGVDQRVDVGPEQDQYIPYLDWTPRGDLLIYRINRPQNCIEVLMATERGKSRVVYREEDDRYIEPGRVLRFLPDGDRFVAMSERSGFRHLYLYSLKKGLLNPITQGEWEVTAFLGVEGEELYYLSTESSPLKRDCFVVTLDGKKKRRLTGGDGTYAVQPSAGFRYYISFFSNPETPNRVTLHRADGTLVRTLEDNKELEERLAEWQVPVKEFIKIPLPGVTDPTHPDGKLLELNGYLLKPTDFDPTKQYPLMMIQYSGPGSQQVAENWSMSWSMGWVNVLVQQGYIVACVDGRGTGFRGAEFRKCTYGQLGRYETEDQIAAARYLGGLPYIDAGRIGIYGWSFGGFMALNCILKGNDVFKLAIAGAPVTSWRFYDTVYTELFNGNPNDNPEGYDHNSPLNFADRLQGKLLIVHGAADDNVHVQNTYLMVDQMVKYDKPFEMYIYPDRNHGMGDRGGASDATRHHLMKRFLDFVHTNL